jgi:hypothetical protein
MSVTHQPGINEGKINGFTLYFSFCTLQGTRTYDAGSQLCRVCYIYEECDVHGRGEMWISEAFHLANLPTVSHFIPLIKFVVASVKKTTIGFVSAAGMMQPLSFSLLVAALAFSLPVEGAENKQLSPDTFSKTITTGYW